MTTAGRARHTWLFTAGADVDQIAGESLRHTDSPIAAIKAGWGLATRSGSCTGT